MASFLRVSVFILLLVLMTGTAVAQSSTASVSAPPTEQPEYLDYRLSLAVSDVVAYGLLISAIPAKSGWPALGGLGVYVLGGPIIHAANGQTARGGASMGMRVLFPVGGFLAGGAIGAAAGCERGSEWGCLGAFAVGGVLGSFAGAITASVIDDAYLGKVPIPKEPRSGAALLLRTATLVPYVDPKRETYGLSLGGAF